VKSRRVLRGDCLKTALKGTIHEQVLQFYELRNEMMLSNIKRLVAANPGKSIVVLTGVVGYNR
jgi:hypothetical protein